MTSSYAYAERMVVLGLLTEPQAAVVMQHYLSGGSDGSRPYYLHNENVQQMLGMTAAQKEELIKVEQTATNRETRLNLWATDPKEQESVRKRVRCWQEADGRRSHRYPDTGATHYMVSAHRGAAALKPPDLRLAVRGRRGEH